MLLSCVYMHDFFNGLGEDETIGTYNICIYDFSLILHALGYGVKNYRVVPPYSTSKSHL